MKRILCIFLASAMALGMSVTSFAATQVSGLVSGHVHPGNEIPVGGSGWKAGTIPQADMSASGNTITYTRDINPNSQAVDYINLTNDLFDPAGNRSLMSVDALRKAKVEVKTTSRAGSQAIEGVTLNQKESRIEIRYAKELVKTSGVDFELSVNLRVDGKNYANLGMTLVGTLANDVIEVYGDYDSVDLSEGTVAEALEHNNKIEVELGNGVTVHTKLFKGKKYYGTASRDPDQSDDAVLKKYPDVDNVLTLKTVGLNSTGDIVKLSVDYDGYYVYDKNIKFLGKATDMLPYSDKYYLANRKLDGSVDDVEEEDPSASESENGDTENPDKPTYVPGDGTGGGGWFDGGQDGSPDTGVSGWLNIAVAGVLLSLGTIVIIGKKRPRK